MSLYNCKSDGDHYRISKFTNDLDVEASYLTSNDGCDCPAGHRSVCRHRIMLPRFIAKNAIAGQWFHNYEHNQWIRAALDEDNEPLNEIEQEDIDSGEIASAASEVTDPDDNYGTGPMMEAVYDLRADQAKDVSPKPINLLELAKPNAPFELGGFPWNCYDQGKCVSATDCILYGCARIGRSTEPKPLRRL